MKVFFIILLRMLKTYKYNKAKFYYWWRFRWWRDVWWRGDYVPSRTCNSILLLRDVPNTSRFTISLFSLFYNVPTPPFYHGYNYKISTHILCIKKMLLRAPCNSCHMFLYKGRFQVSSNCKIAGTISCKKKSDLSNRL